jgi:hypothetical protein
MSYEKLLEMTGFEATCPVPPEHKPPEAARLRLGGTVCFRRL